MEHIKLDLSLIRRCIRLSSSEFYSTTYKVREGELKDMRSYLKDVDFETIKERFDAFWDREVLDRPLVYIIAPREKQKRMDFPAPESMEERWANIEFVLKKMELYLENTLFLGDAIPYYWPNLGPDHLTACLGGELIFKDEFTSWVKPFIEDLSGYNPVLDKNNKWWRIMDDLLDAICDVAEGNFLVGIPDINYGTDSLRAALGPRGSYDTSSRSQKK